MAADSLGLVADDGCFLAVSTISGVRVSWVVGNTNWTQDLDHAVIVREAWRMSPRGVRGIAAAAAALAELAPEAWPERNADRKKIR